MIELTSSYPQKIADLFENFKVKDGVLEINEP